MQEPYTGHPRLWQNTVVKCFARLDIHMARYLLQKQKDSLVVFTSMKEIAEVFVSELRAAVNVDRQSAFDAVLDMAEPPLPEKHQATTAAQAKSKAKAQAKAQSDAGHLPLYDLNSRGEVITGLGRLRALGFDLGSTVAFATALDGFSGDRIFVVTGVSDEVLLGAVGGSEEPARLSVERFLSLAKHANSGASMIKHPGWPLARTVRTVAAQRQFAQARVFFALQVLSSLVGSNIEELVDIFLKPSRQVRASTDLAIGALCAVPEAASVKYLEATHKEAGLSAEAFLSEELPEKGRKILLYGSTSNESVSPFWCFGRTAEAGEVNLVQVYYKVSLVGGPDPVTMTPQGMAAERRAAESGTGARAKASGAKIPDSLKRTVAALASGCSEAKLEERCVYLPVLVNCEAVKAGTELKVAKDASSNVVVKQPTAIDVSQLAKRAKLC